MKKVLWASLILVLSVILGAPEAKAQAPDANGTAAAAPSAPAQPAGRKKRIAIFDFDYATVQQQSSQVLGANVDVGKGIADLLVKYLVRDGTYSIIERKAMEKILEEQNFSNSDRANPTSAAKLGKTPDAIKLAVTEMGRAVGKPWSAEEKTAAAAAWIVLAGRLTHADEYRPSATCRRREP